MCWKGPQPYHPLQSNLNPHLRHLMHPFTLASSCDSPQRGHVVSSASTPCGAMLRDAP